VETPLIAKTPETRQHIFICPGFSLFPWFFPRSSAKERSFYLKAWKRVNTFFDFWREGIFNRGLRIRRTTDHADEADDKNDEDQRPPNDANGRENSIKTKSIRVDSRACPQSYSVQAGIGGQICGFLLIPPREWP
jgi:hypothetical protein